MQPPSLRYFFTLSLLGVFCLSLALFPVPAQAFPASEPPSPGSLDTTFGTGGPMIVDFGEADNAGYAIALQSDGKIIIGGYSTASGSGSLTRYHGDGSLDTHFGVNGSLGGMGTLTTVLVQPDGKILASGQYGNLYRFQSDGETDTAFGSAGQVTLEYIQAIALQPDGKIVAAGGVWSDGILARFNSNGNPDTSFNTTGILATSWEISAVAVQPDGKILTASGANLIRYNANGSLDTTFGAGGTAGTSLAINALILQADGKILAAGSSGGNFSLTRCNANGSADTSFGTNGTATTDFGGSEEWGNALAVQVDGRIVVAGETNQDGTTKIALAGYLSNGSPDNGFDTDGKLYTSFTTMTDVYIPGDGPDVAIQPDGQIVLVGDYILDAISEDWDHVIGHGSS